MSEQITTAAELDALPVGSVAVARFPDYAKVAEVLGTAAFTKGESPRNPWRWGKDYASQALVDLGAVVAFVPGRDLLAEAEARGAREAREADADYWAAQAAGHRQRERAEKIIGVSFSHSQAAERCDEVATWLRARAEQAGGDRG